MAEKTTNQPANRFLEIASPNGLFPIKNEIDQTTRDKASLTEQGEPAETCYGIEVATQECSGSWGPVGDPVNYLESTVRIRALIIASS